MNIPARLLRSGLLAAIIFAGCLPGWSAETKLIPRDLVDAAGKKVDRETLKGKVVALYFATGDNSSCRAFAAVLEAFRARFSDEFAVILVSRDKTPSAMTEQFRRFGKNWLAVPYASPEREKLAQRLEVEGVPTLVVLGLNGRIVDENGCATLSALGEDEKAMNETIGKWKKPHAVDVFFK